MSEYSVLIVDDNEVDRYMLKRHLKKAGFEGHVFEAEDGEIALNYFKDYALNKEKYPDAFPPNTLFLDVNMPRLGGFEFLEKFMELRGEIDVDSLVVMMFSSSDRKEDKEKAFSFPFVKDFIVKGEVSAELLKEKIEGSC